MAFQIYETGSLQVTTGSGVVMDPGGLFVASNWSGSTNIHPLSSSDDIYRNNGPIGENYYCALHPDGADFVFYTNDGGPGNGFDTDNTGSGAGLTYSFWMKNLDASNHWYNGVMKSSNTFMVNYGSGWGWIGAGAWIATESGLEFPYDNDWHHYMQTWDSGSKNHYWYIDGKVEFYEANVTPTGEKFLGLANITALIDEFAFFHKVLTPLDVAPYGKPINPMKKKDEFKLKSYWKCGDGSEQGSGSNVHSLVNGGGRHNTGSLQYVTSILIGSASANLLKNSGKVVDFNV